MVRWITKGIFDITLGLFMFLLGIAVLVAWGVGWFLLIGIHFNEWTAAIVELGITLILCLPCLVIGLSTAIRGIRRRQAARAAGG